MLKIEQRIYDIDRVICDNLDMMDWPMATRALISQNLLGQSRNLVEHIAIRTYGKGKEIALNRETLTNALEYLKKDTAKSDGTLQKCRQNLPSNSKK